MLYVRWRNMLGFEFPIRTRLLTAWAVASSFHLVSCVNTDSLVTSIEESGALNGSSSSNSPESSENEDSPDEESPVPETVEPTPEPTPSPPVVTISGPAALSIAKTGVTLQGSCKSGVSVSLSGTGLAAASSTSCNSGAFSVGILFSTNDGTKNIIASQTDDTGSSSDNRDFLRDSTSPVVSITSPAAGTSAKTGVTLQGSCENGFMVSLSGTGLSSPSSAPCNSGSFSVDVLFSAVDGTKNIIVSQTDAAGNTGSADRDFIRNNTAPAVTITSPAAGTEAQLGITLQGTCQNGLSVNLSGTGLTSASSTTCNAGSFSVDILFSDADGTKNVVVSQTDGAGNIGSISRDFIRNSSAPAITIASPDALTAAKSGITLAGTCTDGLPINLSGTALTTPATTTCSAGSYSVPITFSSGDGTKNIIVSQTNGAGNTGTVNRDFVRDNVAPNLTIADPAALTPAKLGLTISGACEDGITISLSGAGAAVSSPISTTCSSGTYSVAVVFTTSGSSTKTFTVSQTDQAGNAATASRNFTRDAVAPVLTVAQANGTSGQNGLTVSGTCEVNANTSDTIQFSGAGVDAPSSTDCNSDGTYSANVIFSNGGGTKTVVVSQTDIAGNTGSVTRSFIRPEPPVITITSPDALTAGKTGISISGTCQAGLTIDLAGTGLASPSSTECPAGMFTVAITFTAGEGTKAISLSQTDIVGNIGSISRDFLRDTTPPVLQGLSNDDTYKKSQSWAWSCVNAEDNCTYRAVVDQNATCTTCLNAVTYDSTVTKSQSSGDGTYYIHVQAKDAVGNESSVTNVYAKIDNTGPTAGSLSFAGTYTNSTLANLTLAATDTATPMQMCVIAGNSCTSCTDWETFDTSKSWPLTANTSNSASVKFKDSLGNEGAECKTATIIQDNVAPTITIGNPSSTSVSSSSSTVTYGITLADTYLPASISFTGVSLVKTDTADCSLSISNGTTATPTASLTGCTGTGTVKISVAAGAIVDRAGNQNALTTASAEQIIDVNVTAVNTYTSGFETATERSAWVGTHAYNFALDWRQHTGSYSAGVHPGYWDSDYECYWGETDAYIERSFNTRSGLVTVWVFNQNNDGWQCEGGTGDLALIQKFENGVWQNVENVPADAAWHSYTFSVGNSSNVILRFFASGINDFFVDDLSVPIQ